MHPLYSSISTDQPTVLIPFYFCQRMGRKKRRKNHLKQGRESKEKGRLQRNEKQENAAAVVICISILYMNLRT